MSGTEYLEAKGLTYADVYKISDKLDFGEGRMRVPDETYETYRFEPETSQKVRIPVYRNRKGGRAIGFGGREVSCTIEAVAKQKYPFRLKIEFDLLHCMLNRDSTIAIMFKNPREKFLEMEDTGGLVRYDDVLRALVHTGLFSETEEILEYLEEQELKEQGARHDRLVEAKRKAEQGDADA